MSTVIKYLIYLCVALFISCGFAQEAKVKRAAKDYERFAYVKTSEVLLKVANKGYKSVDLFQKLGNSYYFRNDMENASKWYGALMAMGQEINPEYYFRYAMSLKGLSRYEEADKWMKTFNELKPNDSRGKAFLSKVDYRSSIEALSLEDVEIHNLEINTALSDFGTVEYDKGIVFASARGGGRKYAWNDEPFLDLYYAEITENGFSKPTALPGKINTKFHESSAVFSPNGKYLYFTRNNYFKSKQGNDEKGVNRLQLYRATLNDDGQWEAIHKIHFNSENYSVAHPALNIAGTHMYFASDMPGTQGLSDIFVVEVNDDGSLGTPRNLGSAINTEAQESFPFVDSLGNLFFSSTGWPGLGGLDVYKVSNFEAIRSKTNQLVQIENLGMPINSNADDFGYFENVETKSVYFSSNREGGKGSDDIYTFKVPECNQLVKGLVRDKTSGALLANANVVLYDAEGKQLDQKTVGKDAAFEFQLDCEKEYLVRAEKTNYEADEQRFTTPKKSQELELELRLQKDVQEVAPCDDLAKILAIPIIYFDFDKFAIRYDAEIELQKVIAVLKQYPSMMIDIRSHTDCRGSMTYNQRLSENRVQATRQYLINNGIAPNRITAKGYGEYKLVNDCACEPSNRSSCSEEEHQANRRSEFIITSFKGQNCLER